MTANDADAYTAFWKDPLIHPAAKLFPMMDDVEIRELADDIAANGLHEPVTVFMDNTKAAHGGKPPFPIYLLDGRNRLAALKLLGINDPDDAPRPGYSNPLDGTEVAGYAEGPHDLVHIVAAMQQTHDGCTGKTTWGPATNPVAFVLSANVHRRHLNRDQRKELLTKSIAAQPELSDRTHAKRVGTDHKTAGKARGELEQRGEIPHVETHTDSTGRKQPAKKRPAIPRSRPLTLAKGMKNGLHLFACKLDAFAEVWGSEDENLDIFKHLDAAALREVHDDVTWIRQSMKRIPPILAKIPAVPQGDSK
jgi:hypothetical protein